MLKDVGTKNICKFLMIQFVNILNAFISNPANEEWSKLLVSQTPTLLIMGSILVEIIDSWAYSTSLFIHQWSFAQIIKHKLWKPVK